MGKKKHGKHGKTKSEINLEKFNNLLRFFKNSYQDLKLDPKQPAQFWIDYFELIKRAIDKKDRDGLNSIEILTLLNFFKAISQNHEVYEYLKKYNIEAENADERFYLSYASVMNSLSEITDSKVVTLLINEFKVFNNQLFKYYEQQKFELVAIKDFNKKYSDPRLISKEFLQDDISDILRSYGINSTDYKKVKDFVNASFRSSDEAFKVFAGTVMKYYLPELNRELLIEFVDEYNKKANCQLDVDDPYEFWIVFFNQTHDSSSKQNLEQLKSLLSIIKHLAEGKGELFDYLNISDNSNQINKGFSHILEGFVSLEESISDLEISKCNDEIKTIISKISGVKRLVGQYEIEPTNQINYSNKKDIESFFNHLRTTEDDTEDLNINEFIEEYFQHHAVDILNITHILNFLEKEKAKSETDQPSTFFEYIQCTYLSELRETKYKFVSEECKEIRLQVQNFNFEDIENLINNQFQKDINQIVCGDQDEHYLQKLENEFEFLFSLCEIDDDNVRKLFVKIERSDSLKELLSRFKTKSPNLIVKSKDYEIAKSIHLLEKLDEVNDIKMYINTCKNIFETSRIDYWKEDEILAFVREYQAPKVFGKSDRDIICFDDYISLIEIDSVIDFTEYPKKDQEFLAAFLNDIEEKNSCVSKTPSVGALTSDLASQLLCLQETITDLNTRLDLSEKEVEAFKNKASKAKSLQGIIAGQEQRIKEKEVEISILKQKFSNKDQAYKLLQVNYEQAQVTIQSQQGLIYELQQRIDEQNEEIAGLKNCIASKDDQIASLKQVVNNISHTNTDQLNAVIASLQAEKNDILTKKQKLEKNNKFQGIELERIQRLLNNQNEINKKHSDSHLTEKKEIKKVLQNTESELNRVLRIFKLNGYIVEGDLVKRYDGKTFEGGYAQAQLLQQQVYLLQENLNDFYYRHEELIKVSNQHQFQECYLDHENNILMGDIGVFIAEINYLREKVDNLISQLSATEEIAENGQEFNTKAFGETQVASIEGSSQQYLNKEKNLKRRNSCKF